MISLLVTLLIVVLIFSIIAWVLGQLALPQPIRSVVLVILAVLAILVLLQLLPLTAFHEPLLH